MDRETLNNFFIFFIKTTKILFLIISEPNL